MIILTNTDQRKNVPFLILKAHFDIVSPKHVERAIHDFIANSERSTLITNILRMDAEEDSLNFTAHLSMLSGHSNLVGKIETDLESGGSHLIGYVGVSVWGIFTPVTIWGIVFVILSILYQPLAMILLVLCFVLIVITILLGTSKDIVARDELKKEVINFFVDNKE